MFESKQDSLLRLSQIIGQSAISTEQLEANKNTKNELGPI